MRIFNLAEELEKERQKNKKLQERIDYLIDRNDEKENKIEKAIEYIENGKKGNWIEFNKIINILKGEE